MKHKCFVWLCIALFQAKIINAQCQELKSIDSLLTLFTQNKCFNGDVLITINNKAYYKRAVGYRDNRTKEKLQQNSIFNIGSISKPFTSVAILQLQENKLLNIEDNVKKYIPEFPFDSICIKHLLSHTSGITVALDQIDDIDLSRNINNDSIVSLLIKYKIQSLFSPGSEWAYSNIGYDLLAIIVERVSRMKFVDFMQQNIFIPAGMQRTFIPSTKNVKKWLPKNVSEKDLLVHHMFENISSCVVTEIDSIKSFSENNFFFIGSSNVYSTTNDLSKFDQALRNDIILSKKSQELAYTPFVLTNGDTAKDMHSPIPSYYGLGWLISIDKSQGRILWHKGRSLGSRSIYIRNIDKKQTVIFTDNFDYAAVDLKGIACFRILNHQKYRNPILMSLVQKFGCGIYSKGYNDALIDFKRLKDTERQNYYIAEEEMIELGNILANDEKMEDAISVLNFCKELFPKSSSVLVSLADILLRNNNPLQATENYKEAIIFYNANEIEKESLLNNIGYQFLITNRLNDAELVLKLNTELFLTSGGAFDSYATSLEKNNKLELAIFYQEKAVSIANEQNDPLLPTLLNTLKNLKSKKP